ncbi:uncharacterized protein [Eleutherodactylus coqui]|uniref:uncharacterized protein n=1 Tax=Eleutherodactylus coqui TaxID=57060 RepID=UPI0034634A32
MPTGEYGSKPSWADQVEEEEEDMESLSPAIEKDHGYVLDTPREVVNGNIKTITEYRLDEDDKKIKIVRTFKTETRKAFKVVARRKNWKKVGNSQYGPPGPNIANTVSDDIEMTFITNKEDLNNQEVEDPMNKLKGQKIVSCRICKGDHWTTRCPYKDTLGPMQKELAKQLGLSTADNPKRRQIHGHKTELAKKRRLQSHATGSDCKCQRYRCFTSINEDQRATLLQTFNGFPTKDHQDSYLSDLIELCSVKRRRPRKQMGNSDKCHDRSYLYKVRVCDENHTVTEVPVCHKAFIAFHGITNRRVQTIKKSLVTTGVGPTDKRGKHKNRPHRIPISDIKDARGHLEGLREIRSCYSLKDSAKVYLPEELNVVKLYKMFKQEHPNSRVSQDKYRRLFNEYNISFGAPRTHMCSFYDAAKFQEEYIMSLISNGETGAPEREGSTASTSQTTTSGLLNRLKEHKLKVPFQLCTAKKSK